MPLDDADKKWLLDNLAPAALQKTNFTVPHSGVPPTEEQYETAIGYITRNTAEVFTGVAPWTKTQTDAVADLAAKIEAQNELLRQILELVSSPGGIDAAQAAQALAEVLARTLGTMTFDVTPPPAVA